MATRDDSLEDSHHVLSAVAPTKPGIKMHRLQRNVRRLFTYMFSIVKMLTYSGLSVDGRLCFLCVVNTIRF